MSDQDEAGRDKLEIDNMFLCGSRLTRVSLKDSVVMDSHLINMRFEDVLGTSLVFDNANLTNARFSNVNMTDVTIDNANLQGLAVTNANITGMTIDGILLSDLIALYDAGQGTDD